MKNWTQRLAIFAFLGAILSSAVLVGCGGGDATEGDGATGNTTTNTAPAAGETDG